MAIGGLYRNLLRFLFERWKTMLICYFQNIENDNMLNFLYFD